MKGWLGSRIRFQTLTARITALILTAMTVFTLVLGLTAYNFTRDWLSETAITNLEALASARQTAVEIQLHNYMEGLNSFIQPDLEADVRLLAAGGAEHETRHAELVASLKREQTVYPYLESVQVVDLGGTVIAATAAEREELQVGNSATFAEGQIRAFVSEPFAESGEIFIELSRPLRDEQNNTIAVLMLRFNAQELIAITGDYTGLGESGETVLGSRRGEEIHFLAPLRFDPNLSEIEPVPANGERARPMIHATAGQSGLTQAPDYRGVQVIAAYRPIELTGWGVVIKQDVDEAFAGVSRLQNVLFLGLGMVLFLGVVIITPLVRTFTRPLRELEQATRRVAGGDPTASVPIDFQDEVGQLAGSFNTMVTRLREAHDELERSNQELTAFAYVVSHDLKAPLRGIANLSEWLEEDLAGKLGKDQREQIRLLRGRVGRMDALINGLLEYSRVGRVRTPVIDIDMESLLVRVIDTVNPPDQIRVHVTTPMPTCRADELRLSQVFQNLIDNAVKFHPGPQGKVEVTCRDAGDNWEFSVSDDGLGIEPRYHKRIFQIFQSLHPRDDAESTGIGLALVKKIVEDQGGNVWVVSDKPGQGATFKFTWPKG